ncbi:hypothetical protein [Anaerophilus nitritogenes]|uniref:hypothetical protein n=1 Tax=Anaerophilus nitritogenes TaxID=2498136 RepID=UPI00101D667D|nr:hypothetical protein [Anaerophilus nitritogenes]
MSKGGKRKGSGRKKIGKVVNIRIQNEILNEIDNKFEGNSKAERIRSCLKKGLGITDGEN